jgi:hypothetical protein
LERVLRAQGIDGHNSHTNVQRRRAPGVRALAKYDRPGRLRRQFILLISAHPSRATTSTRTRSASSRDDGAELAVRPAPEQHGLARHVLAADAAGQRAAVLLAMARAADEGLSTGASSRVGDWREYGPPAAAAASCDDSSARCAAVRGFAPEFAAAGSGARGADRARGAPRGRRRHALRRAHLARPAAAASAAVRGPRAPAASVLTGAVGTSGTLPRLNKFVPSFFDSPPPRRAGTG